MLRLTLPVLLAALLAGCEGDTIVDPSTDDSGDPQTTSTTTTSTTDPTTGNGPFPGPTSETTTIDPTDTTTAEPILCDAMEPIDEAAFPSAMAMRVCQQRAACGCASPTCTIDVAAALSDMATWSKGQPLQFDTTCAASLYARAAAIACDDAITAIEQGCASCAVYRDSRPADAACDLNAYTLYATQCAPGLACNSGSVCATTELPEAPLGGPCFVAGTTVARCSADAVCDAANTGACVTAPAVGEPCFAGTTCAAGQWCADDGRCRLQKSTGEPCTSPFECHALECSANVCASTPWICRPQWSAGA